MRYCSTKSTLAGLLCAATLAASLSPAVAGPIGAASSQTVSLSAPTDQVYYRRWGGRYGGYRRGWGGYGGGLAAGAALGLLGAGLVGAAAAPYYGYGGYGYAGYGYPYYGTYGYAGYPTCSGAWGW